jgi:signal transduction histidine kinase/CheY-like chemotaxis protein
MKIRARPKLSFSIKVLTPVVSSMVLLLGIAVWILDSHTTRQFETEAARRLLMADESVRKSQDLLTKNLLLRYRNLPQEPRYKVQLNGSDPTALRRWFEELLGERDLDVILYSAIEAAQSFVSAKRDPLLPLAEFDSACSNVVARALSAEEKADTVRVGDRLFNVVSVPVFGAGDHLIGALALGSEIDLAAAQELRDLTQCQVVFVANRQVAASTLIGPELRQQFVNLFQQSTAGGIRRDSAAGITKIFAGDEHYFCIAGRFKSLRGDGSLGYLLLSSYEQPLRALHRLQQTLLLVSSACILVGTAVVWFLLRKVTQPLRALRDSAEAVGRGDFSRRVEVRSRDECGELADVFNRMTTNLQSSHEQLEMTVETLKTTQAQLVQSEKLSGIGEFVAGVAHELNNPLTSVMGFSELLKKSDVDPQHQHFVAMIHKSALRCQKIVQSLLSFARRHQPERKLASLNELAEGAVEILQYQMRTSNIEVITRLDPGLPQVMIDPHQVQQVFINIINNARQAIEAHRPSGWVRITSERQGNRVRVIFQDNGPGIPEADLSKVFDPFFTTKEVGKGTGLGLSLCYGIIHEHGGLISVRSKLGEGATFFVELPLAANTPPAEGQSDSPPAPVLPETCQEGVGKKVLVIDDEESILHMVREVLKGHGYEVDVAQDGETALRRMSQTQYDLALCDWKMPGLNGQQVYERLRVSNPKLSERMIFITGDVVNDRTQRFLRESKKVCLTKPFSLTEFRAAIGQALAE